MTSREFMRAELAALDDEALFQRTIEIRTRAREYMDSKGCFTALDRAWCDCCWYEWCDRGKSGRYIDALPQSVRRNQ